MLRITAGAREKEKSRMRWMENIKSVTGSSVNGIKQLMQDREKVAFISVQNSAVRRELTNSMAYGTRRFNATFTRALQ